MQTILNQDFLRDRLSDAAYQMSNERNEIEYSAPLRQAYGCFRIVFKAKFSINGVETSDSTITDLDSSG
jgi:DNA-binding PucR family transcriptional regulator